MPVENSRLKAEFYIFRNPRPYPCSKGDDPYFEVDDPDGWVYDVATVAQGWFEHTEHNDIEEILYRARYAYFDLSSHDPYDGRGYPMLPLFLAFIVKELHGWEHESALCAYLKANPSLLDQLGFDTLPAQSTFWRTWNKRFSADLREAVRQCADEIIDAAHDRDVPVPDHARRSTTADEEKNSTAPSTPIHERVFERTSEITNHAKRVVFPAFSLDRAANWSIHENASWELQTYIGLRDGMAVSEGARSFLTDSTREKTPLGHIHRHFLRQLPISETRTMYREAIGRIIDEVQQKTDLTRPVTVAIDTTENSPFTGDRTGHEDEIIGTKQPGEDYAYQWATIQVVDSEIPLILDALPIVRGNSRAEIVADLLDSAQEFVSIELVLMDREFDGSEVKAVCEERGVHYLTPKRKYRTERETIEQMKQDGETVRIVPEFTQAGSNRLKLFLPWSAESKATDETDVEKPARPNHRQEMANDLGINMADLDGNASPLGQFLRGIRGEEEIDTKDEIGDGAGFTVFQTNHPDLTDLTTDDDPTRGIERIHMTTRFVRWYHRRQEIEVGYKKVKQFMAKTTSKQFGLRFFYFAFACLLYSIWRLVDLLVQLSLFDDVSSAPLVTANDVLTIVKKTGIG